MFIAGHEELLELVIKALTPDEREYISQSLRTMRDGLRYPDLPCAQRALKNGKVFNVDYKPCPVLKMRHLFGSSKNRAYEIYLSHNGRLAFMHAMTPASTDKQTDVQKKIIDTLVIMFRLAVHDDTHISDKPGVNAFWLGQVLHTVMDSYSPAHTYRMNTRKKAPPIEKPLTEVDPSHVIVMDLFNALEVIAPDYEHVMNEIPNESLCLRAWLQCQLARRLRANQPALDFIATTRGVTLALDLFKVVLFQVRQIDRFKPITRSVAKSQHRQTVSEILSSIDIQTDERPKHIVRFLNFAQQGKAFHMKYDLLKYVKKYGLNEYIVRDCCFLIRAFVMASRTRNRASWHRYCIVVRDYLERFTFKMK